MTKGRNDDRTLSGDRFCVEPYPMARRRDRGMCRAPVQAPILRGYYRGGDAVTMLMQQQIRVEIACFTNCLFPAPL